LNACNCPQVAADKKNHIISTNSRAKKKKYTRRMSIKDSWMEVKSSEDDLYINRTRNRSLKKAGREKTENLLGNGGEVPV